MKRAGFTDEEALAVLLRIKRERGGFPSKFAIRAQAEAVELLKRGWVERRGLIMRRAAYVITTAGYAVLVDVPGSGVTRSARPLPL